MLKRILFVCKKENVDYTDDGLEAILFTAQGDMRQVFFLINNINNFLFLN